MTYQKIIKVLGLPDGSVRQSSAEKNKIFFVPVLTDAGFPIWWYVAPTIINTFVENVDLDGKKVIPFATSGGSGMGKTLANLKPSCLGANWVEGKVINGMSEKALADWAEKL